MQMQSSLQMVFDSAQESPAIRFRYIRSEDLRDSVFGIFKERFGHRSRWCLADFKFYGQEPTNGTPPNDVMITPIPPQDLLLNAMRMLVEHFGSYDIEIKLDTGLDGKTIRVREQIGIDAPCRKPD